MRKSTRATSAKRAMPYATTVIMRMHALVIMYEIQFCSLESTNLITLCTHNSRKHSNVPKTTKFACTRTFVNTNAQPQTIKLNIDQVYNVALLKLTPFSVSNHGNASEHTHTHTQN